MPRGSAFLVLIVLGAAPALAAEPPAHVAVRLDYTLNPGTQCPAPQVLHDEVARHLGYDPFRGDAPGSELITVVIGPKGRQVSSKVSASGIEGALPWSREAAYPAEACPALLSWLGIVISFHLDQERSPARSPKPHQPDAGPPPPAALPAPPVPPPPSKPPDLPKLEEPAPSGHLALALGPQLTLGAFGTSFSLAAYVGWRWPFFSFGGELRYDAPTSTLVNLPSHSSVRVSAQAVGGALAPCGHFRGGFLCALLSGGAVLGNASGVSFPHAVTYPYLGSGVRLGFEQAFKPWLGIRFHVDGLFMFQGTVPLLDGVPTPSPTPLSSRVNGATGLALMTYF